MSNEGLIVNNELEIMQTKVTVAYFRYALELFLGGPIEDYGIS
jgi:hypothetical protein